MATTTTFSATGLYSQWYGTASRLSDSKADVLYNGSNETAKKYTTGVLEIPALADVDWSDKRITKIILNYTPQNGSVGSSFFFWRSKIGSYTNYNGEFLISDATGYIEVSTGGYTNGAEASVTLTQSSSTSSFRWMCNWVKGGLPMLCMTLDNGKNTAASNTNRMNLSAFSLTITYETNRVDKEYSFPCVITDYAAYRETGVSSGPTAAGGGRSVLDTEATAHRVGYYYEGDNKYKRVMITIPTIPTYGNVIKRKLMVRLSTNNGYQVCFGKVTDTSNLSAEWFGIGLNKGSDVGWVSFDIESYAIEEGFNFAIWPTGNGYSLNWVIEEAKVVIETDVQSYNMSYDMNGGSGSITSQTALGNSYADTKPVWAVSSSEPVRATYEFLGWSESATATSASYTSGESVSPTAPYDRDLILYAVWKLNTITVILKPGQTGVAQKTFNVVIGEEYALSPSSYWDNGDFLSSEGRCNGYNFRGWSKSPNATGTQLTNDYLDNKVWDYAFNGFLEFENPTAGNADETWYAVWSAPGNIYIKQTGVEAKGRYNNLKQCVPFCNTGAAFTSGVISETVIEGIAQRKSDGTMPTPPPISSITAGEVFPSFWFTNS